MATAKKAGIVDKVTRAIAGIFSSGAKHKPAAPTATAKSAVKKTAKKASTAVRKAAKKVSASAKKAAKKPVAAKRSTPGTSMDRKLIALSQPHEVRDWCKSMDCTEAQLRAAVAAVGNSAAKVRAHLREGKVGAL